MRNYERRTERSGFVAPHSCGAFARETLLHRTRRSFRSDAIDTPGRRPAGRATDIRARAASHRVDDQLVRPCDVLHDELIEFLGHHLVADPDGVHDRLAIARAVGLE